MTIYEPIFRPKFKKITFFVDIDLLKLLKRLTKKVCLKKMNFGYEKASNVVWQLKFSVLTLFVA